MRLRLKPYPEYKNSGLPWLGEIPAHWTVRRLKHWVKINASVLPETTPPEFVFRYLDIRTVGTGFLTQPPEHQHFGTAPSRARRILKTGDTIVSTVRTYLKAVYFIADETDNTIASTGFAVLSPKADTEPKFVSYLAQSALFTDQVTANSVGIAYPAIAETKLGGFHVSIPSRQEQAAIVRLLTYADRRVIQFIRTKQRLIKLLNEQKQAVIHRAVTRGLDPNVRLKPSGVDWIGDVPEHWTISALRLFYSVQLGKMLDAKRILGHSLIPYLRNTDVQWDKINTTNLPLMDIEPAEYDRYTVQPGDLLVCEGGDVGRSAFWNGGELALCGYQKALHRVRPLSSERSVPRFLYYVMYAASKCGVFLAGGSENTIAHLTCEKLRAHRFAFPNIQAQQAIVQYLDSVVADIEVTITRARCEIELIREYRTRLVADVVTGKLDVRSVEIAAIEQAEELEVMETGVELEAEEIDEMEEAAYADD